MDRYEPPLAKLYDLFEKYAETEHFVSLTGTDAINEIGLLLSDGMEYIASVEKVA